MSAAASLLAQHGKQYVSLGYDVVPIATGHKWPRGVGAWQTLRSSEDSIDQWMRQWPHMTGVGILAKRTVGVDIDVLDASIADELSRFVQNRLGPVPARVGKAPKLLLPYRCEAPFSKSARTFRAPDGTEHKVEILGDGQQFVASHIHPSTGEPYRWYYPDGRIAEALDLARRDLPAIEINDVDEILRQFERLALERGLVRQGASLKASSAGGTPTSTPAPASLPIDQLRRHLAPLGAWVRDDYDAWFKVLAVLHHESGGNEEGLALAHEWSSQSPKYDRDSLEEKWATLGKREGGAKATLKSLPKLYDHADPACEAARNALMADEFDVVGSPQPRRDRRPNFVDVDLSRIGLELQAAPKWFWQGYLPAGEVTLLAADGGAGKSTLALMLAACMTAGADCLGRGTTAASVAYFSAEDTASTVLRRLALICDRLGLDPESVRGRLRVLDATDGDSVLFAAMRQDGVERATPTAAHAELAEFVESQAIDVLIVDNASDVYDADENRKPMVRAFIKSLARMVRARDGAVLLLAHVDKNTSRAGVLASGAAYSGSVAWNNSVRSRLFLLTVGGGRRELQHQKSNLGPLLPPLPLEWPDGGLPGPSRTDAPARPTAQDLVPLLTLIHEFYRRQEWISPSPQAHNNVKKLLGRELGSLGRGDVLAMAREAQRARLIEAEEFRTDQRKPSRRWKVTPAGLALIPATQESINASDIV